MIRVVMWKTKDGVLCEHRAEAAYRERERRKADQKSVKEFLFKCCCMPIDRDKHGRLPAGTWVDEGEYLYAWSCAGSDESAMRRAVARCQSLRERTGMPWEIDYEMRVRVGKQESFVNVPDHPLMKDLVA